MKNTILPEIRQYIKDNHGWSGSDLGKSEVYKKYTNFMDSLKQFDFQKVKLTFTASNDFLTINNTCKGTIRIINGKPLFFKGRATKRYCSLDAGLYEGWSNTLIILEINQLN